MMLSSRIKGVMGVQVVSSYLKRLMSLLLFVVSVSAMGFSAQADLWELVLSNTTLSRAQFDKIYQGAFHSFDQAEYRRLLHGYLEAVQVGNWPLAQEALVSLSAATIFNAQADYLPQALQVVNNPWGQGAFWISSSGDPWEFQIFNFLINQFMLLYHKSLDKFSQ